MARNFGRSMRTSSLHAHCCKFAFPAAMIMIQNDSRFTDLGNQRSPLIVPTRHYFTSLTMPEGCQLKHSLHMAICRPCKSLAVDVEYYRGDYGVSVCDHASGDALDDLYQPVHCAGVWQPLEPVGQAKQCFAGVGLRAA